jgi:pimeloyl-ACP methyl ester carboxylesterase
MKLLTHRRGAGAIIETTSMQMRVLRGPPDTAHNEDKPADDERESTIATGIVRLTAPALVRGLTSFRPRARSRRAGAVAVARFWASVAGAIADVYVPRPTVENGRIRFEPLPPIEMPRRRRRLAAASAAIPVERFTVEESRWQYPLNVERFNLSDEFSGSRAAVEHVFRQDEAPKVDREPVLLIAGSSVGASIFRPAGVTCTIIHRLIDNGYDVWVEDWRGSLRNPPIEYALDEAAVMDHPHAVEYVSRRTGSSEVKAVVHCLGSSGFMLALAGGLLHQDQYRVPRVVSNSVSLHPVLPYAAEQKLRGLIPVYNRLIPYLDPQWAREHGSEPMTDEVVETPGGPGPHVTPGGPVADVILEWVRLTHRECEDPVCNFGQFMYGAGPSTLYDERYLQPETRTWMRGQLAWAPIRLYRQISRSLMAGHLVPMREWEDSHLPERLFEDGPAKNVETRITFMTGSDNRCFSPLSQRRTHEWFSAFQPNEHMFKPIDGFGHLDVWLRDDNQPVHDVVLDGLRD